MHSQNFLSIILTAKAYGVSRSFLQKLNQKGRLKFHYINDKPFIKLSEFEALMKPATKNKLSGKEAANA